jgi:NADH-quinone oxidoreductase subunit J
MSEIAFYVLSAIALLSAVLVVFAKSPVHSVLYLVLCFFSIAGHYILMNAEFLAIVHIIVYAGAIMVLFLFVVMMLNLNKDSDHPTTNYGKLGAVVASGIMLMVLTAASKSADIATATVPSLGELGSVQSLGKALFTTYLLPFELSSVLLFAAIAGAVMLAKKDTI